jgi:mitochondrial cardiolipin hydrolase
MKEILGFLNTSFEDGYLSKAERKAIQAIIEDKSPSERELAWLRSQIFDIAKNKTRGAENIQVLDWLESANKLILPKLKSETYSKAYFSPGTACVTAIVEQIGLARSGIDICVFTISDDRIADKLIFKHKMGIKIRILTDNDKCNDMGSDIQTLANTGLQIKVDNSPNHMHNKFAIFDGNTILTGSYNWTRSAALYNQENVIVSNDKELVKNYTLEFNKLWNQMQAY